MVDFPQYPVFVADQVLTADHLNEIVNYLDEQQRLSRNKLIGIGIVCGLEIKVSRSYIEITKGCGITSQGYLIIQDDLTVQNRKSLTHYHEYILPTDFSPAYKTIYEPWHMWELLTAESSLDIDDAEALTSEFLRSKIVVLLLEMKEIPLKNCIDTDCDDKGCKIEFTVRPLLVESIDIDAFIGKIPGDTSESRSADEIQLKRYNVPATSLASSDDVLNAFLKLADDSTLSRLSQVLNTCYNDYNYILTGETVNPFTNVLNTLSDKLNDIKSNNPYFIQYYCDWIDDIIKAYYEFKDRAWYVQMMCCPNENLFPLHLMLGEADKSTSFDYKSKYRQYFIYSPLFNSQKDVLTEIQFLFRRLRLLIENYQVKNFSESNRDLIKITPSKYLDETLSQRCIPYYYNPIGLLQCWNWNKTKTGKSNYNLSYNANLYTTSDVVINPLNYDIENYTFFRIEGHIGKNYSTVLKNIIGKRDFFNLPFDVAAISTSSLASPDVNSSNCEFQDLQALYEVLVAELMCKIGGPVAFIGDLDVEKTPDKVEGTVVLKSKKMVATPVATTPVAEAKTVEDKIASPVKTAAISAKADYFITDAAKRASYQKGEIFAGKMENANKVGSIYSANWIKENALEAIKLVGQQSSYLLVFINTAEDLFQALPPFLSDFNLELFLKYYKLLISQLPDVKDSLLKSYRDAGADKTDTKFTEDYALYFSQFQNMESLCFDKQFAALSKEFEERVAKLKLSKNIAAYFKSHYGYEHKAGVPKGGTFVLVYNEVKKGDNAETLGGLTIKENQLKADTSTIASTKTSESIKNSLTSATKTFVTELNAAVPKSNTDFLSMLKDSLMLSDDKINDIIKIINPLTPASSSIFDLEDQSVIADFYIPYLCSSNCAPIVYVCSPNYKPDDKIVFDIQPRTFLFDDARNYPFTAEPKVTDTNTEQNPFVSDQLTNPGKLKLWTDAGNILYLHPAMSDLTETLITPLTYKNITVQLTIIKPDATFTINTTKDASGQTMVQVAAKNKDATKYEWKINGIENIFQNVATPPAISFNELRDKTGNKPELIIELTIIYVINDVTSTDAKQQRLPIVVCVDFESPLVPGTIYGKPANQQPDEIAFTTADGITVKVEELMINIDNGAKMFDSAVVQAAPGELGSGQSIRINNINLEFDFSNIGFITSKVDFRFYSGGIMNLSVNRSPIFLGDLSNIPPSIGGVNVSVAQSEDRRVLTFTGEVKILTVGGQEFGIDNVCAYL